MSYWGDVERRARRETLEMLKLEQPGRAVLTLGLIATPAAITWLYAADVQGITRALATAAALAVCGAIVYAGKTLSIPPTLAKEEAAERAKLQQKLASFESPDDDASLREGLAYIFNGTWGDDLWENTHLSRVGEVAEQVRRLAARERIHIWGRVTEGEVHQIVPIYFWTSRGFDILTVAASANIRSEKNAGLTPPRWNDLRINRAEFEREWATPL